MASFLSLISFLLTVSLSASATAPTDVTLTVGGIIAHTSAGHVSANFDWHTNDEEAPAWVNSSVQVVDLSNKYLVAAAKALAPGRLRIGGSEGDKITYNVTGTECAEANTPPAFCLNMDRWKALAEFCDTTGMKLVFGLNSMVRANKTSPLNFTNHEQFLRYTATNNINVYAFELGNENEDEIDATVFAHDYLQLRKLIDTYWTDSKHRPKLAGCDDNPDASYMNEFLPIAGPALDVTTYHDYVDSGLDPNAPKDVMEPWYLDAYWTRVEGVVEAWQKWAPHTEIWVGETAATWHSGRNNVTNAFESNFWYVDWLSTTARHNHTGVCRQTLRGGWYGLLDRDTYQPNPDFYAGLLYHNLMSDRVLSATLSSTASPTLRAYSQCTHHSSPSPDKGPAGVTVALLNMDADATFSVTVAGVSAPTPRSEYHLTAEALTSKVVSLNGQELHPNDDGSLPTLNGVAGQGDAITIAPHSIVFATFPNAACGDDQPVAQ